MALKSTILTDVPTKIYQSDGCTAITTVYFCNTGAVTVNFNVYATPRLIVPDNTNLIYSQISLPCNDTFVLDTEKLVLEDGDALYAKVLVPPGQLITNLIIVATVSAISV